MINTTKPKIVVITGPTATGKTALSVEIAKRFNGEIISADSMQIYKHLDIGTAKVTEEEKQGIKHYLLDFLEPDKLFSVADFVKYAQGKIKEISDAGKLPIVVGGTGLYISSLVNGISFTEEKTDQTVRANLEQRLAEEGIDVLFEQLAQIDETYANKIDKNNHKRVLRGLEIYMQTGITMSQQIKNSKPSELPYNSHIIALNFSDRENLYNRINARIDIMLDNGLLAEAKYVYENKQKFITAAQAIGYKEFFAFFEKNSDLTQCAELLKQSSRRYAKRQITWIKRMENVNWIMLDKTENLLQVASKIIE